MTNCPYCEATAIDVTTHEFDFDQRHQFMCTGAVTHRWREGDGPIPLPPEGERLIILARG